MAKACLLQSKYKTNNTSNKPKANFLQKFIFAYMINKAPTVLTAVVFYIICIGHSAGNNDPINLILLGLDSFMLLCSST